jgi:hypothetical protein
VDAAQVPVCGLNLFVVCNLFLFLISEELFKDPLLALLPCIVWGFSLGAMNTVTFIRMYMLLTTLTVIFAYYNIWLIENNISNKFRLLLFLIVLMGVLTHYYFLVFIVIWAALFSIYWLLKKRMEAIVSIHFSLLVWDACWIDYFSFCDFPHFFW